MADGSHGEKRGRSGESLEPTEDALRRVRRRYEGTAGERWRRIEAERPRGYAERNVVVGRRELRARVLEWAAPLEGRRVLDAGCGTGTLSRALAREGARVVGVDLVPGFVEAARARGAQARFRAGNFLDHLAADAGRPAWDLVLLIEVVEDYPEDARRQLVARVAASGVPRVLLAFRTPPAGGPWNRWLADDAESGIDSVALLRWIHLATGLRQVRRFAVQVRNYRAQLADLRADAETAPG